MWDMGRSLSRGFTNAFGIYRTLSFAKLSFDAGVGVRFKVEVEGQAGVLDLRKALVDLLPDEGAGKRLSTPIEEGNYASIARTRVFFRRRVETLFPAMTTMIVSSQRCEDGACTTDVFRKERTVSSSKPLRFFRPVVAKTFMQGIGKLPRRIWCGSGPGCHERGMRRCLDYSR